MYHIFLFILSRISLFLISQTQWIVCTLFRQILKHKIDGIRRISSHPLLPLCEYIYYNLSRIQRLTIQRLSIYYDCPKIIEDFISNVMCLFSFCICDDVRFDRIAGWFCIFMGMGTSDGSRNSESARHFRQSDPRAIFTTRQQVRSSRFWRPSEFVSSSMSGRNGSTILCKNLRIPFKMLLLKVSLVHC